MSWFLLLVVFWKPLFAIGMAMWYWHKKDTTNRDVSLSTAWDWLGKFWELIKPF